MDQTTVELNGVRIYTRRVGDGPPVVVLHGGPGAHHDYLLPQYDRLALVSSAPLTAAWRDEFDRRLAARMTQPWIARARAELTATGLSRTDPEKYRRLAFALSVAGYFHDPSHAREMTPFRVTARTQQAVWQSLGSYDLRARVSQTFPDGTAPRALLLHGIYDPMPLESARETAALLSTGVIQLATGHAPHVEATADFVRTLDPFLPQA